MQPSSYCKVPFDSTTRTITNNSPSIVIVLTASRHADSHAADPRAQALCRCVQEKQHIHFHAASIANFSIAAFVVLCLIAAYLGLTPNQIPQYGQSDKGLHFVTFFLLTVSSFSASFSSNHMRLDWTIPPAVRERELQSRPSSHATIQQYPTLHMQSPKQLNPI